MSRYRQLRTLFDIDVSRYLLSIIKMYVVLVSIEILNSPYSGSSHDVSHVCHIAWRLQKRGIMIGKSPWLPHYLYSVLASQCCGGGGSRLYTVTGLFQISALPRDAALC